MAKTLLDSIEYKVSIDKQLDGDTSMTISNNYDDAVASIPLAKGHKKAIDHAGVVIRRHYTGLV